MIPELPEGLGPAFLHDGKLVVGVSLLITLIWWALVNLLAISLPYMQFILTGAAIFYLLPKFDAEAFPNEPSNEIYMWRIGLNLSFTVFSAIIIGPLGFSMQVSAPTSIFQIIPAFWGIVGFFGACRAVFFCIKINLCDMGTRRQQLFQE